MGFIYFFPLEGGKKFHNNWINISPQNVESICTWQSFSKQCCWEERNIMPMATQAVDHYETFILLVSIWSLLELNLLSVCLQALVGLWILTHDGMLLAVHRQYRASENLFSNTQIICDQIQTSLFYSFWHSHVEEGSFIQNKQATWHPCTYFQSPLSLQFGSQGCWSLLQLSQGQGRVVQKKNNKKK